MKNTFRTTVCCIACTLIAASTWAQREPGSSPGSQQTPGSPSSSSQRSSQGGLGSQSQSQRSTSYSSSMHGQQQSLRVSQQIINAQVKTQDGQQLGQIEDLIANPQTGKIEFAVVSKGDKLCPIPMQLLQPQQGAQGSSSTSTSGTTSGTSTIETTPGTPGTSSSSSPSYSRSGAQGQKVTFTAQVDRSKLEQAPSFSRTQWPEISQTWSQQVYSHFGVQPEAAGGTSSSSSTTSQGKSSSSSSSSDPSKSSSDSDTEKRSKDKEN